MRVLEAEYSVGEGRPHWIEVSMTSEELLEMADSLRATAYGRSPYGHDMVELEVKGKDDPMFAIRLCLEKEALSSSELIVARSDDFGQYRKQFAQAAEELIESGRCTKEVLVEMGGWWKSMGANAGEPIYFTYCEEEKHVSNRIYLNAETGEIFR